MAKRNVLSLKRKIDLLKDIETKKEKKNPTKQSKQNKTKQKKTNKQTNQKQVDIASQYNVSQATVSSISKNSEKLKEKFYGGEVNAKVKCQRLPHQPKVDSALLSWV